MLEKRLVCASPSPSLISHHLPTATAIATATLLRFSGSTNSLSHAREMQLLVFDGAKIDTYRKIYFYSWLEINFKI